MVKRTNILTEFVFFVKERQAYWIIPVIVILLLMALVGTLGSTAIAPFIYTIF